GRVGLFIGCTDYPTCEHTAPLSEQNKPEEEALKEASVPCPSCKSGHVIARQARFGKTVYAFANYPDCYYAV
ncbi:topoisomerase DNA-binding C4 zinc finger domain-containing protein, partial [Psychromonas arctica]